MAALSHAGTLPAGQAAPSIAFIAQIGQAVAGSASAVTELRLTPEELGLVRIELQTEGEKVSVTLIAERAETLDLLRRHSERLISELRNVGFSQLDLGFGNHRDGQAGAYNAAPLLHQGRPIADLPTDLPAEMAAPLPAWPASVDGSSLYMRL
ncbi:flagellar hook-length control protein FliK [Pseudogemmobacter faecipullorum]|uniref:Flagellar hook-length control protein FliK n=1 Tax=Pseudogemmobacter faecipullorum TaxID=2755041 RepID=A0ABS8CJL4_9RHOB|nr:flagellar hook-length control protein FliK [Pseudogemmobacter faecipullorum]MCB5409584.1 flagellar hook-length control protein FliK [Pseudogemmobacter faecipullorum]